MAASARRRITALHCSASLLAFGTLVAAAPSLAQVADPASTDQPAGAIAADSNAPTPTQAEAATNSPEQDSAAAGSDVIVTGIRKSLQSAQAIKKNSDVVVDSISAEDIGALPDRSVTEALQRVPGVAITRFDAGNDPDHFAAQGSGAVIRGLTYTRSEINGRDTFTANNGRGLSFGDIPSELLAGVDVFKSSSADLIEGGIAGTVNLRTRVPFDASGLLVAGTLENSYSDLIKKSAPTVSALISDRWHTGIGEFGLLASAVRSQIYTRTDGEAISNYGARIDEGNGVYGHPGDLDAAGNPITGATVYIPRGARLTTQEYNRVRYGFSAAGQWRSNDESMTATFQFIRSDSREKWNEHTVEIATDNVTSNGDSAPLPGTSFTFDDDGVFTSGTITGPNGYRADQNTVGDMRTPINGLQSNNQSRGVNQRFQTNDYGANFKWKVTDRLGVNLDYQHTYSRVQNTDFTIWTSSFQNVDIGLKGNDPAYINFVPLTNQGDTSYLQPPHTSYLDPYNTFYRNAMDHIEDSDGNEDAARIDLDYSFPDADWLTSVRAGYRFADRENTARFSTYNWGVVSEIWGGTGPVWLDDNINGNPDTAGGTPGPQQAYFFDNFFRGKVNTPTQEGRLFVPTGLVSNYAAGSAAALQIGDEWRPRLDPTTGCPQNWVPLAQRCGVVAGTPFLPGEINPVHERSNDAYGEVRYGHRFGNDWNLTGNVGVRYTQTKRTASGFQQFTLNPLTCTTNADTGVVTPEAFCALPAATIAAARAFANGATTPIASSLSYHYWLPSFNAKLEVGGGVQFRAAFNKNITPPDFGLTRAYYTIGLQPNDQDIVNNGGLSGLVTVGNPMLKPIKGTSYDLTAEWYFSQVGQLTLSLFKKDLKNVVINGTTRQPFTNNGATFDIVTTQPLNSDQTGRLKGAEVGYQQTYSFLPGLLSGLGLAANFTYVESSGVPQSTLNATDPSVSAGNIATVDTGRLPLQGLSKYNFNLTPFFTYKGLELRAAYSWRSRYLLTTRDVIVPFAPVFSEKYGTLDASIFYSVNKNIRMGFQGVNLTNSITQTTQVINDDLLIRPRQWFVNDRRFTFSIRAQFGS